MNKGILEEIEINICKALITSVTIELKDYDKEPFIELTVRGNLMTRQNKVVSEFWYSNNKWISDEKKIEVPLNLTLLTKDFFTELTPIIYRKLNDTYKQLGEVSHAEKAETVTEEKNEDSDIPF